LSGPDGVGEVAVGVAEAGFDHAGVARSAGVELSDGTGVDAREPAGDGLADAGDGVGVGDVGVSASALFGVTLKSASFW